MTPSPLQATLACRPGLGGVVQIWCRGPGVREALSQLVRTRAGARTAPATPGAIRYGFVRDIADPCGAPIDEVLAAGADWGVELNCHGGSAASLAVMSTLRGAGFEECDHDAWWRARCGDGEIAYSECEARILLARARTGAQARLLCAGLDFHTRCDALAMRFRNPDTAEAALAEAEALLDNWPATRFALRRHTVAIVGAPNVGKSTCLNALAMRDRSLVSATPGATRDAVRATVDLDGLEVELTDTAGFLEEATGVDACAIERSRRAIGQADLRLLLLDRSRPLSTADSAALAACGERSVMMCVGKCDLPAAWDEAEARAKGFPPVDMNLAMTQDGCARSLADALSRRVRHIAGMGKVCVGGPVTERQAACIADAVRAARRGHGPGVSDALERITRAPGRNDD